MILSKRSIIDNWRDPKFGYVIYLLITPTFNYSWCKYLISNFNYFQRGVEAINHVLTVSRILYLNNHTEPTTIISQ